MKDLKGKVALVTGAAMGMGRSLSEDLLREGCSVILVDVNEQELLKTQAGAFENREMYAVYLRYFR